MSRTSAEKRKPAKRACERPAQDGALVPTPDRRAARRSRRRAPGEERDPPSKHLAPEQRMGIYREMYFLRLQECLVEDYPAVVKLAGPPRSSTGARVLEEVSVAPLLVEPARPEAARVPRWTRRIPRRAVLADVARVEECDLGEFRAEVSVLAHARGLGADPAGRLGSRAASG